MRGSEVFDPPEVNLPLLRKVVDWAEAEAARADEEKCEWYQDTFRTPAAGIGRECGTVYCIAGYVCESDPNWDWRREAVAGHSPGVHAMGVLGITDDEAWANDAGQFGLFSGESTIEDVRDAAERIAERAGEKL